GHAAVIGRAFAEDVLAAVARTGRDEVRDVLSVLRERDLLVGGAARPGAGGEPELMLKHALIRDAAYDMLPKAVRATAHFPLAGYIEERAGERVDEISALLAEHYERAAQLADQLNLAPLEMEPYRAKALHYLELAGDSASALYSNADAFGHYEAAAQRAGDD